MGNENTGRKLSRTVGHRKKIFDISSTPILQKSRVQDENGLLLKESPSPQVQNSLCTGNKISRTVGPRKRLTDITNTPILSKSRAYEEDDQLLQESLAQLQDELANVKKMLAAKEEQIEENKRCMQKLWFNYCRKTKQNDEIILHNSQLDKDLTQALEKLKVLEHENVQMSALYKFCKLENLQKLTEALEEVDRLTKLLEASRFEKAAADQHPAVKSDICKKHGLSNEVPNEDCTCASIHSTSILRKRQWRSYKEPSSKQKMRQADGKISCSGESVQKAAAQPLGKAEVFEAVLTSSKKEIEVSKGKPRSNAVDEGGAYTEPLQQFADKNGGQLQNKAYVSTQKSCERPLRRAASSIGSYKEPTLNTKMRRAD